MVNVYIGWEPAGMTPNGPQVASRIIVDGKPVDYPKMTVVSLLAFGFSAMFHPNENESHIVAFQDWEFAHQTLLMWAMRVIISSLNTGEDGGISSLEDLNIRDLIDHLEETLKKEDNTDEPE